MQANLLDIIYLRLSKEDGDVTEGSETESCSIQSQRKCIHRYLETHRMNPAVFEEYVDDGYSGTTMKRPGMAEILDLVEQGLVRTLVVRDLSRFARNYIEAGHYLEFVFPMYDVRFISINDQFDSADIGESTGGLELAIKNLLNQMYSKDISKKIKSAVDLKKMNGEYVYGNAPYGYRKGEQKNTIVIDEPAALVVRRIFRWAAMGISVSEIARRLNSDGIETPSVYLAAVRGKYKTRSAWSFESVRNILENRIYTGDTVPFKSHVVRVGSDRTRPVPLNQQVVIPNTHEAIISRELFQRAHEARKRYAPRQHDPNRKPYEFQSVLTCGCCGNKLARGKRQNKDWLCTMRRYTPDAPCTNVRINDAELLKIVTNAIRTQSQLVDIKIKKLKNAARGTKTEEQLLQAECRQLRNQLEQVQKDKMASYECFLAGRYTKEQFLAMKTDLSELEAALSGQLKMTESQMRLVSSKAKDDTRVISRSARLTDYQNLEELSNELVRQLIKEIIIYPDNRIKIVWNFHDDVAAYIDEELLIRIGATV